MVGHVGKIAEVQINRSERQMTGNYLYGAFGRDFLTKDGKRVMIVGLTSRQWQSLVDATGIADACAQIEKLLGVDLSREGDRFAAREVIGSVLKTWTVARTLAEHTDEVLEGILGLSPAEIGHLHDEGVVAGPKP